MREPHPHESTLPLLAVTSRYEEALTWAREHAAVWLGPLLEASEIFDFTQTDYYRDSMGADLKKQLLVFATPADPATLPRLKLQTGAWERAYAALDLHPERRPLNLDPGYLTQAKIVLASTKDHSHRIYLGRGIYGEVTLFFQDGAWRVRESTFPDYRRPDYHQFFTACRARLKATLRENRTA